MIGYESYKYSGAAWIGDIPSTWEVGRLKNHLRRTDARNPGGVQVLSLYRELGIVPKDSRDDNHNVTSEDTSNYKYVQPGDFVVNKMKAWQGSVAVSDYEGIVSPAYYVYKFLDNRFYKRYFHYLIRSCYKEEFMSLSAGIRIGQWDLSSEDLDNVLVLLPTTAEQMAIADYLDREVERIDAIIAEAKASIEEYKAWKAAVIYEAVTKGLDLDAEMKDSGIDWIGQMPMHWNRKPIKRVVVARDGGAWGDEPSNTNADRICMRIADFDFEKGRFKRQDLNFYTKRNYSLDQTQRLSLQHGDLLIEKSGGGEKTPVGRMVIFDLNFEALYANFMERLRVDTSQVTPEFFSYYWRAMYSKTVTTAYIKQTTGIQNLNITSLLEKECVLLPQLSIQDDIVVFLNDKCNKIDALIFEKASLVSDLDAYKKSLIFEVVTGKRKVV